MKNILCYGDSNTWGYVPDTGARYPQDVRWTGVMQRALGADYRVIEEGLNGRTTAYEDMRDLWRNGRDYLPACLISHKPLDLLILSLGTNDLKFTDAFGAAKGCESLIMLADMVQNKKESSPVFPDGLNVLIVSPILLGPGIQENPNATLRHAYEASRLFCLEFERVAQLKQVHFLDAAAFAQPSIVDHVHMAPDSHLRLGTALAAKVRDILANT